MLYNRRCREEATRELLSRSLIMPQPQYRDKVCVRDHTVLKVSCELRLRYEAEGLVRQQSDKRGPR